MSLLYICAVLLVAPPTVKSHWFKGIVHFEIKFWYVLAYLKGIQDVGVFVSAVQTKKIINTVRFLTQIAHFVS